MTYQPAVHSKSTPGPPSFPPLLLSSSKGLREKRWSGAVFVGSVEMLFTWSVNSGKLSGRRQDSFPPSKVHLYCPNQLPQLRSLGGNQGGQAVDWGWNVKNSCSDRCGCPGEKR